MFFRVLHVISKPFYILEIFLTRMNQLQFLILICLATVISSKPSSKGYPCGIYEQTITNEDGEIRCIPNPGSCIGSPDFVNIACFISPCMTYKSSCPQATYCFNDACNACKARTYDSKYNEVCIRGPF